MTYRTLSTLALASTVLSSCIYYTTPVPEMPYYRNNPAHAQAYAAAARSEGAWYTTSPTATMGSSYEPGTYTPAAAPLPAPQTAAAPIPAPAVAAPAKPSTAITQPQLKLNPVTPKPAQAAKPAAAPKATTVPEVKPAAPLPKPAAATTAQDPKDITNNGPIPVATPVPGDPTRVYNPLNSNKTIRITDKNGKIYPSGKELKVRGTNFHFYVP